MSANTDYRPTRVEIDLAQLRQNIQVLRSLEKDSGRFLAVIKANAYGHGILEVAKTAEECGADMLGVAIAEEGIELRQQGIHTPILILGASTDSSLADIIRYHLTPAVFSMETLQALEENCEKLQMDCSFHFKVDTGMNRIGFTSLDDFKEALDYLKKCPRIHFDGMFTHFAVSECEDSPFTKEQAECFIDFASAAKDAGYRPILHAANSGALLRLPEYHFDMVRAGIVLYGYHPAGSSTPLPNGIKPILSFKTGIVNIKTVPAGQTISYGRTYRAERDIRVATLPVGYGDGYKRSMSNKAEVLIHGIRCPQVGTICMDQIMVDVSSVPDARIGDEAVLLGKQGNECITADDLAEWADTISYEILLSISSRVPRIFLS